MKELISVASSLALLLKNLSWAVSENWFSYGQWKVRELCYPMNGNPVIIFLFFGGGPCLGCQ